MKKLALAAVAALTLAAGVAPSFAGNGDGIQNQSANIRAGGAAYPTGVVPFQGK
jgi:hypothetical protein